MLTAVENDLPARASLESVCHGVRAQHDKKAQQHDDKSGINNCPAIAGDRGKITGDAISGIRVHNSAERNDLILPEAVF